MHPGVVFWHHADGQSLPYSEPEFCSRGGMAMPVRTGEEYITGLREQAAEVYICGEQVKDVTTHPAFRNGVRTIAGLYDMQHDPARRDAMTYISPTTGDQVGLSFITPRTVQDLE